MGDQPVQVGVGGPLNVKVAAADIVKGFVVKAKGAVSVFEESVGRKH